MNEILNWSIGGIFSVSLFTQLLTNEKKFSKYTLFMFLLGNVLCIISGFINDLMYIIIPSILQTILLLAIIYRFLRNHDEEGSLMTSPYSVLSLSNSP